MLLLIDNYDSFTFNLVQCFCQLKVVVKVLRPDAHLFNHYVQLNPAWLVIGPGPGNPSQAGISKQLLAHFAGKIPILGVCLGHQCLAELFGGTVVRAAQPMHGKISEILHDGKGIFSGLPPRFEATRYHSLIVERDHLPACLEISAETVSGEIMGLRHREFPALEGVQFHPESIMTRHGPALLENFIQASHLEVSA